jgi:HEAT repeat protein
MRSSKTVQRGAVAAVLLAGALAMGAGCRKDEFDADTWTGKLNDQSSSERAITAIERIGDPKVMDALGRAWEKQGRPERILRVMIDLAKPLTEDQTAEGSEYQYTKYGCTKSKACKGKARPASWDKALPYLRKAIEDVDKDSPRSVESARLAAEALGKSKIEGALEILASAANSAPAKPLRGQAILSLGELGDPKAVPVLANIIREDFNPQRPELHGAALLALGRIKSPEAVPVLIEAMYRLPFFFKQVRRALVASGSEAVSSRIAKILKGEDADVNALFKDKNLGMYCGDVGKEPVAAAECLPVAAMDYYASIIAGDLYDPSLVGPLLEVLKREAKPAYYLDFAPGPPAQNAALDSLRKIGSPEAAPAVLALWTNPDSSLRPMAANVFSYVSRDGSEPAGKGGKAVDLLGKIAADNGAEQGLRLEAATAYARLANRKDQIPLLRTLADKYQEASDKAAKEADGKPKTEYEKVKGPYDAAKANLDAAKKKVRDAGGEGKAPVDLINDMTKAKEDFEKVKVPYTTAKNAWKTLQDTSEAYRGFQRVFETHIARIEVAIYCATQADQIACLAGSLNQKPEDVFTRVKAYVNPAAYTEDDKKELMVAEVERALLDLGKQGPKAAAQIPVLLEGVKSKDRLIRQSVLLALPKVAGKDCKECVTKLDAAIRAAQGDTTLADLNVETEVLRSYFSGAVGEAEKP